MTREQLDKLRGHTPGPWVRNDKWEIVSKGAGIVCRMQPWDVSGCRIDDNANAELIAAAPDLLAHIDERERKINRLQEALEQIDRLDHAHSAINCTAYYAGLIARKALAAREVEG